MKSISAMKMAFPGVLMACVSVFVFASCLDKAPTRRETRDKVGQKLATRSIPTPPVKTPNQAKKFLAHYNTSKKGGRPLALSKGMQKDLARVYTTPGEMPQLQVAVDGENLNLPLRHTHVSAEVVGQVTKVEVSQTYSNPFSYPIEAIYVFPLPENSAVYDMKIVIGSRVIQSDIQQRAEARETYETAKREGYTAALLEQERPNVFTQSVANIEPGNEIAVIIQYVQNLSYDNGEYEFVFPMVVGPRFFPGQAIGPASGTGTANDTTIVPDASRVSPPILGAGMRTGHDISLEVSISAGLEVQVWSAPTHDVNLHESGPGKLGITLADHDNIPNRDFVLRYKVAKRDAQATLFPSEKGKEDRGAFSLIIQPPNLDVDKLVGRREMIFVLDVSGSMFGRPLGMCKIAMEDALEKLRPVDTFNVFTFAGRTSRLFKNPWPANEENIRRAHEFVDGLSAGGGTMMGNAVQAALSTDIEEGRDRYVFFLTDGYVGNESQIHSLTEQFVDTLAASGHKARVFGFGIGSSSNRHLLEGISRAGRGIAVYATNREDPFRAVEKYFNYVDHPVLENVTINWGDARVEDVYPRLPANLYVSRPLVLAGRFTKLSDSSSIEIVGQIGNRTVRIPVDVQSRTDSTDTLIQTLWAREKIDWLEGSLAYGSENHRLLAQSIEALGLEYNLVTRYTSLVAVDRSKKINGQAQTIIQAVETPEDVDPTLAGARMARQGASLKSGYGGIGRGGGGAIGGGTIGIAGSGAHYNLRGTGRSGISASSPGAAIKQSAPARPRRGNRIKYARSPSSQSKREFQKTMEGAREKIERCAKKLGNSSLPDTLMVKLEIDSGGQVKSAIIEGQQLPDKKLERCILTILESLRFTGIRSSQTIRHPFRLGTRLQNGDRLEKSVDDPFH